METNNSPAKISVPFAENGDKVTIPVDGADVRRASMELGFPPLTGVPKKQGGVEPKREDFNGILNQLSDVARWNAAGGRYKYDAEFATAIGGYPKGAILSSSDSLSGWLNTVENNTTNPDTGGAGWEVFPSTGGGVAKQLGYNPIVYLHNIGDWPIKIAHDGKVYHLSLSATGFPSESSITALIVDEFGNYLTSRSLTVSVNSAALVSVRVGTDGNIYLLCFSSSGSNESGSNRRLIKIDTTSLSISLLNSYTGSSYINGSKYGYVETSGDFIYFITETSVSYGNLRRYQISTNTTSVAYTFEGELELGASICIDDEYVYVSYSEYAASGCTVKILKSPLTSNSFVVAHEFFLGDNQYIINSTLSHNGYIYILTQDGSKNQKIHKVSSTSTVSLVYATPAHRHSWGQLPIKGIINQDSLISINGNIYFMESLNSVDTPKYNKIYKVLSDDTVEVHLAASFDDFEPKNAFDVYSDGSVIKVISSYLSKSYSNR